MRFSMWRRMLVVVLVGLVGLSCGTPSAHAGHELPKATVDLPAGKEESRTLVLAGGCFWCMEAVFERLAGVTDVTSGYAGGTAKTATYELVSSGRTDHAESGRVSYDSSKVSYGTLLRVFFTIFDPTTLGR